MQNWKVDKMGSTALELETGSGNRVVLTYSPPSVVCYSIAGDPVLKWNADGYFHFEHTRTKQVGVIVDRSFR